MNQESSTEPRPVLVAFTSPQGTPHYLTQPRTVVGSGREADIRVHHSDVEERHCLIMQSAESFDIFDLTSSKVLQRNERIVDAAALDFGDELHIGSLRLVFVDRNAAVLPPGLQLAFGSPVPFQSSRTPATDYYQELLGALRRAPWFLLSMILHLTLYFAILGLNREKPDGEGTLPSVEMELADIGEVEDPEEIDQDQVAEEIEEDPETSEVNPVETFDSPAALLDSRDPNEISSDSESDLERGTEAIGQGQFGGASPIPPGGALLKRSGLSGAVRKKVESLRQSGLDIVILMDATASMSQEIHAARKHMSEMITLLESFGIGFRIGVVAFRDHGDAFVTRVLPLTAQRFKAVHFMDQLEAVGGGDHPEAVYEAIRAGTRLRYSRKAERVMILIGDAPPHEADMKKSVRAVERFAGQSGRLHAVYAGSGRRLGGRDEDSRNALADLAGAGGGRIVSLSNHTQLVIEIVLLTLGATSRESIEQTIDQVTESVSGRLLKRRIQSGDLEFVARELSRERIKPLLPLTLLRESSNQLIPAYMDTLRNPKLPAGNRWLAHVLLKRQLNRVDRFEGIGRKAQNLIEEFHPELASATQRRILRELSLSLERRGIRTTLNEKK